MNGRITAAQSIKTPVKTNTRHYAPPESFVATSQALQALALGQALCSKQKEHIERDMMKAVTTYIAVFNTTWAPVYEYSHTKRE